MAGRVKQNGGMNLDRCWPEQTDRDRKKYVCMEHLRPWPHDREGKPTSERD